MADDEQRSLLDPQTGMFIALFVTGVIAGVLMPRNGYLWRTLSLGVLASVSLCVGVVSTYIAYNERSRYVPIAALLPSLGLFIAYERHYGLVNQLTSIGFYLELALGSALVAASWGMAGGLAGYILGVAMRDYYSNSEPSNDVLLKRMVFVAVSIAIVAASFAFQWVNRGLGDGI